MRNYLKDTLLALADAHVGFVVAGGVACVLHGVERMTLDLDIAIDMSPDNVRAFLSVMDAEGLTPRAPVSGEILLDPDQRRQIVEEKNAVVFSFCDPNEPLRQVDVFLTEDHSYDRLSKDAANVEFAGRSVSVAAIDTLVELKSKVTPHREKDESDIKALRLLKRGGRS